MKEIYLFQLNEKLKAFLSVFLIVLSCGIFLGLAFLFHSTSFMTSVTTEQLVKSKDYVEEDFGIDESKAKSTGELLMTTHNHILGFSFIFLFVGIIFYFNSVIDGFWKTFLLIEPLISIIVSFGSMWAVRLIWDGFIYLTVFSALLMYLSYFLMVIISLYDLNLKRYA